MSQIPMDIVLLQCVVKGAGESGVEYGRSEREADDEEGTDGADDCGGDTAQTGKEGEEADEDLYYRGDKCDNVGDEHPFRDCLVGIQSIAEFLAKELVDACIIQAPDLHRVEPELILMRRAECDMIGNTASAVLGEVPRAVVP